MTEQEWREAIARAGRVIAVYFVLCAVLVAGGVLCSFGVLAKA